jgi:hypothetical protein
MVAMPTATPTAWQQAREMWCKAWWFVRTGEGGPNPPYSPDPNLISDAERATQATEYIEAHKAYLAKAHSYFPAQATLACQIPPTSCVERA